MDDLPLVAGRQVWVPDWLGPTDHVWLGALLDEVRRMADRPLREWRARASEPLRVSAPAGRLRAAVSLIDELLETVPPTLSAPDLRWQAFSAAQRQRTAGGYARGPALDVVANELGLERAALEDALFADLPGERRLVLPELPDPPELALRVNHAVAQRVVRGATAIDVTLSGAARPVIRQLLLRRLLLVARPVDNGVHLRISGPIALFRHTTRYGRALGSVVPVLRAADSFVIIAHHRRGGRPIPVRVTSDDPVFPAGAAPKRFDSKLEERFAREFLKAAPDWDLVREPEPVEIDGSYVFPDFAVAHRRDRTRRWLLEIVGYWSPDYLDAKLRRLSRAGRADLIVCVDTSRGDGRRWQTAGIVVPFEKRVDPADVLRIIEPG